MRVCTHQTMNKWEEDKEEDKRRRQSGYICNLFICKNLNLNNTKENIKNGK